MHGKSIAISESVAATGRLRIYSDGMRRRPGIYTVVSGTKGSDYEWDGWQQEKP